ncbi:MAG: mechanosensitive ion channel [Candidatus Brocadia sp.]|uniref:Mechanosensitive ion channel n=1 Tax=Candidatus Brocadia fulgida TaxID=380242 RepID=A0A0M2V1N0_9BACT|nr:MAG: hypothetical protein BROFUL_00213 [Candidatus Brocadia fulgida]UJS21181.1 MAG: mechanosensitive ion channel [Candidatus Brocadia sp.]
MTLKSAIRKCKSTFVLLSPSQNSFVLCMIVCLFGLCPYPNAQAQTAEKKEIEIRLSEMGVTIKPADIEKARIKEEEIKLTASKSLDKMESLISDLERDARAMSAYIDRLQQERDNYPSQEVNSKYLELLDKEIATGKEKRDTDNELIETYKDRIEVLQDQSKAYDEIVVLLRSILRLEEALLTSHEQAPIVRKEADIARSYITAMQASIKEKESVMSFFSTRLVEIKVKVSEEERDLAQYLETLKAEIGQSAPSVHAVQEKIDSIVLWKKAIGSQWIMIFETRLETSRIRYDKAQLELRNAEFNAAFLAEKAKRLEEKVKAEEVVKKQADLEVAKKAEEQSRKIAEMTKAEVEKALQEAVKKGEEVAVEQILTASPEKKRVLELEADVHRQSGLVAKRKEELITDGMQRFKDVTEYKELEANIGLLLSRSLTTKEIDESVKKMEAEKKRFLEAIKAVESLIPLVQEEKKLASDNCVKFKEEQSKIEEEVASFSNKELVRQAREYSDTIVRALEEQDGLISARLERLTERLKIKKYSLTLLEKTKEKLINMKAANIWTRIESSISVQTVSELYKDMAGCYGRLESLYSNIPLQIKNFIVYISGKRHAVTFWIRLCGLTGLIAGFYFSKKHIRRWSAFKIQALYETADAPYYRARLFPSLLFVLQKSIHAMWLAIFSLSVPGIFSINTPFIKATRYVFIFFAVYKILKCFLIESFSPEKGDKKLVTSLAYISPKHIYKSLNIILLFSFVSFSLIAVLTIFGYRNDVVELLWFLYRVGISILILWLAAQKTLIFKLLPSAETQFVKLIHRIITVIYPIFITFVVSLFAIRILGYQVLFYVLLKTCIKSFAFVFIAFWVWKYLYHQLVHVRERRFNRENLSKDTVAGKRFQTITTIYHVALNYLISIVVAIIIIRVWIGTFRDAVGSSAAPYLVHKIFRHIGVVLGTVGSGLRYRFILEEGRYTTPIKIIVALVVLFISFFIARQIKKLLDEKVFYKLRLERGLKQTLSTLIRYIVIGIAALIGLNIAGIPLRSLAFFAGAFGIGIGFGMQNIISNFVSGIILLFERPIRIGDVITLEDGTLGTIDKFNARSTTLTTPDGITITVPNSKFVENRITNWTNPTSRMRGSVKMGVAYGSDIALVKKCLMEIARQNPNVRTYPEPFVRFSEFGDSALIFELFFWADDPGKRWFTMSELNFAIDEVFKKNHIEYGFPRRNIHIRPVAPSQTEIVQDHLKEEKTETGHTPDSL